MSRLPTPRAATEEPPPPPDVRVNVYLNAADHEKIKQLAARQMAPGALRGNVGSVSAFFRYIERVVIEDWT